MCIKLKLILFAISIKWKKNFLKISEFFLIFNFFMKYELFIKDFNKTFF